MLGSLRRENNTVREAACLVLTLESGKGRQRFHASPRSAPIPKHYNFYDLFSFLGVFPNVLGASFWVVPPAQRPIRHGFSWIRQKGGPDDRGQSLTPQPSPIPKERVGARSSSAHTAAHIIGQRLETQEG